MRLTLGAALVAASGAAAQSASLMTYTATVCSSTTTNAEGQVVTETITSTEPCHECEMGGGSKTMTAPMHSTVYVTSYVSDCPTTPAGMKWITTTVTESCTGEKPSYSGMPANWHSAPMTYTPQGGPPVTTTQAMPMPAAETPAPESPAAPAGGAAAAPGAPAMGGKAPAPSGSSPGGMASPESPASGGAMPAAPGGGASSPMGGAMPAAPGGGASSPMGGAAPAAPGGGASSPMGGAAPAAPGGVASSPMGGAAPAAPGGGAASPMGGAASPAENAPASGCPGGEACEHVSTQSVEAIPSPTNPGSGMAAASGSGVGPYSMPSHAAYRGAATAVKEGSKAVFKFLPVFIGTHIFVGIVMLWL